MVYLFLEAVSLPALAGILILVFVATTEIGTWLGGRARRHSEDKDAGSVAAAALGLLALLIAFTYSMAVARYDLRRNVVLEEANAIGSTVNFALMLPAADQAAIIADLRDYTDLRIRLGAPYAPTRLADDIAASTKLQGDLWRKAIAVTTQAPQSLPAYRFVASLNEMNNVGEKRVTALRNHVPVVIFLALAFTGIVAMGFSGYAAGIAGISRRASLGLMSLLVAVLIVMTQDLQRPDRGTIEISTQPLQDALAGIPASPGAAPATP